MFQYCFKLLNIYYLLFLETLKEAIEHFYDGVNSFLM
jgi:hypothetical protein